MKLKSFLRVMGAALSGFILVAGLFAVLSKPANALPALTLEAVQSIASQYASLDVLLASPLSSTDYRDKITTLSASNSAWTEFPATDIPTRLQNKGAGTAQIVTVVNNESTSKMCIAAIARSGATDCSSRAASLTETCDPSGTPTLDGDYVAPSVPRQFIFGGDMCIFYRSSVANGDVQLSLVAR